MDVCECCGDVAPLALVLLRNGECSLCAECRDVADLLAETD